MGARNVTLVTWVGLGMLVCIGCQTQKGAVSLEAHRRVVQRQVDEVWNAGNLAVLDELMAPDFVSHRTSPGIPPDRKGFAQIVSMHRKAFSDLRVTVEDMVADGDKVANRWSWTGTHDGVFMGIQPTGKRVTQTGISIHRFEGGKIVEQWHEMDTVGVLQQLGAMRTAPGKM